MSEVNPYQAPQTRGQAVTVKLPGTRVSTTAFVLIFLAICLGIISFLPWLGVIFLIGSTPVFIRLSVQDVVTAPASSQLFRVLGNVLLAFSIFIASVGAFWGTCHSSGFATAMFLYLRQQKLDSLQIVFTIGTCVGLICGCLTFWQLSRLFAPSPSAETDEDRSEMS